MESTKKRIQIRESVSMCSATNHNSVLRAQHAALKERFPQERSAIIGYTSANHYRRHNSYGREICFCSAWGVTILCGK